MENEKTISPLFPEFPPISKDKWKDVVLKDLKGASFDKLIWKTYEGFAIEPLYTKDDVSGLDYLEAYENISDKNAPGARVWENREKIKVEDEASANTKATEALHGGATGLSFEIPNPETVNFAVLLNAINLETTKISFVVKSSASTFQKNFFNYLAQNNFPLQNLRGSLEFDPISTFVLTGNYDESRLLELVEVVKNSLSAPNFYTITVNSGPYKDSGASVVQELAYTVNAAAFYFDKLTDAGLTADQVAQKVQFSVSVGVDYFMEIAKLKALRILFLQVAKAFGANQFEPGDLQVHAYSSLWSKTVYDPSVNLLRDTTEAMSAILGGCNSLSIEPYDSALKNQQPFLKRIARNISTIIKEESYLDKVVDPVAGSYYIENLINQIASNSWTLFQEVESAGGFVEAFKNGLIQSKIKAVRDSKRSKISGRRDVIVGTNQYPNAKESVNPENILASSSVSASGVEVLVPERATKEFEDLRLDTEGFTKKTSKKPTVFLLEFGTNVNMRKARASFSMGFFGTAGFGVVEDVFSSDVATAIEKAKKSNADIVVFCASDDDYLAIGVEFANRFKAEIKDKQLVLAGYPTEIVENLKSAGFDEFIHIRSNAIETLRGFQKKLNII
jgi:methylmalonyl-CoA mutase